MDEPRDPFLDESDDPWHYALRKGEMVFRGLAEIPSVQGVAEALKDMSESDLKCIVLERLYVWHAQQGGPPALRPADWLTSRRVESDDEPDS